MPPESTKPAGIPGLDILNAGLEEVLKFLPMGYTAYLLIKSIWEKERGAPMTFEEAYVKLVTEAAGLKEFTGAARARYATQLTAWGYVKGPDGAWKKS